jgi:hypothetical protein
MENDRFRTKSQPAGKLDNISFKFSNPTFVTNTRGIRQLGGTIISQSMTLGLYSSGTIAILKYF